MFHESYVGWHRVSGSMKSVIWRNRSAQQRCFYLPTPHRSGGWGSLEGRLERPWRVSAVLAGQHHVMSRPRPPPAGWQTRLCHHLSPVFHWGASSRAPSALLETSSAGPGPPGCTCVSHQHTHYTTETHCNLGQATNTHTTHRFMFSQVTIW